MRDKFFKCFKRTCFKTSWKGENPMVPQVKLCSVPQWDVTATGGTVRGGLHWVALCAIFSQLLPRSHPWWVLIIFSPDCFVRVTRELELRRYLVTYSLTFSTEIVPPTETSSCLRGPHHRKCIIVLPEVNCLFFGSQRSSCWRHGENRAGRKRNAAVFYLTSPHSETAWLCVPVWTVSVRCQSSSVTARLQPCLYACSLNDFKCVAAIEVRLARSQL